MNHTPTPWKIEPKSNYDDGNLWIAGKDRSICRIDMPDSEDEANAQFIITACNAHEELVDMLNYTFEELNFDGTFTVQEMTKTINIVRERITQLLTTIENGA